MVVGKPPIGILVQNNLGHKWIVVYHGSKYAVCDTVDTIPVRRELVNYKDIFPVAAEVKDTSEYDLAEFKKELDALNEKI